MLQEESALIFRQSRSFFFQIFPQTSLTFLFALVYQAGSGLVGDDDPFGSGGAISARIESSYIINLRDLEMKHVKDFIFVHGECFLPSYVGFIIIHSYATNPNF